MKKPTKKATPKKATAKKAAPKKPGRVAQRSEQRTSKAQRVGSNPTPVSNLIQHPRGAGGGKDKSVTRKSIAGARAPVGGGKRKTATATPATQPQKPKRGRGRPATGFDKKSYQREYMREYRAALKAEKTK